MFHCEHDPYPTKSRRRFVIDLIESWNCSYQSSISRRILQALDDNADTFDAEVFCMLIRICWWYHVSKYFLVSFDLYRRLFFWNFQTFLLCCQSKDLRSSHLAWIPVFIGIHKVTHPEDLDSYKKCILIA